MRQLAHTAGPSRHMRRIAESEPVLFPASPITSVT